MSDPIVTKILIGLVITLTFGMITQVISRVVDKKIEKMTNSGKLGMASWLIILMVYYISMLFYWIGLLGDSIE